MSENKGNTVLVNVPVNRGWDSEKQQGIPTVRLVPEQNVEREDGSIWEKHSSAEVTLPKGTMLGEVDVGGFKAVISANNLNPFNRPEGQESGPGEPKYRQHTLALKEFKEEQDKKGDWKVTDEPATLTFKKDVVGRDDEGEFVNKGTEEFTVTTSELKGMAAKQQSAYNEQQKQAREAREARLAAAKEEAGIVTKPTENPDKVGSGKAGKAPSVTEVAKEAKNASKQVNAGKQQPAQTKPLEKG